MNDLPPDVGAALAKLRQSARVTQSDVAPKVRVDQSRISRIESGDVLLFRGRTIWSWLIQLWTDSDYSHAAMLLWMDCEGVRRLYVVEAKEGIGVRAIQLDKYMGECRAENCGVSRARSSAWSARAWSTSSVTSRSRNGLRT